MPSQAPSHLVVRCWLLLDPAAAHMQPGSHTATASEPGPRTPPPAKRTKAEQAAESTQPTMAAQTIPPAPQTDRWVDRDWNAALNMQRIGESRWRPLELCWWPDLPAQPAMGEDYQGLGYERL
ncbi:hypothetical protein QJQ45_006964 [Haematococcus lacustris]|nr:hypothetical protein QJQ45_006964 [Haematococcus lacustris]